MRVDLGGLMPHVLRSKLDSLHPRIGLEAVGSTVPVAQGLVDGVFHRVRGECFDMVAQNNQGFIQPLRTDLRNATDCALFTNF